MASVQSSRGEMATVSNQVVDLAGKLETECLQRSDLQVRLCFNIIFTQKLV